MATDLERLVVQLSADVKSYEREMARARGVTNREMSAIERRVKAMNRNISNIGAGFGRGMAAPLASVAGALSVAEVIKYADAWKRAGNQLKVSGIPANQMAATLDRLYDIAQGAGTDLGSTVTLFSRLSQSAKELGANQQDLFRFTKGVGDALKVAGTDAASASGALLQLSQALGGAVVRAEEFNSINEGARPILQAVADGLDTAGGSVSKLRELVIDGKVSSQDFFNAFLKGSSGLAAQAQQASTTFGQAFVKIENAFTKYIGQTDEGLGASQRLIKGLESLADNFDSTADKAIAFASILAAGLLGRSITRMVSSLLEGGSAILKFASAIRTARAAAAGGSLLGAFGAAAGPLGAAIGVAAGAAVYFATSAAEAAENSETAAQKADRYAEALKRVKGAAEGASEAVAESGKKFVETETFRLGQQVKGDIDEYKAAAADVREAAQSALDRLNEVRDQYGNDPGFKAQVKALETLRDSLDGTADGGVKAQEALNWLAKDDVSFEGLANRLNPLLDKLIGIGQAIKEAREEMATLGQTDVTKMIPRESAQEAAESNRQKRSAAWLAEQQALELRSQKEKEIAALTEKLLKDAEKAGESITEAEAAASARATVEKKVAQEAAERKSKEAAGALDDARKALIDTAQKFQGFSEHAPGQRDSLRDFFKAANMNVDPKMTAWCAAFVNAVLAANGLPGSGSLMARSFLDYGTATQEPQPGDLVILKRGRGNVQGHVGFYMGAAEGGGIRVLGGNQGDKVSEKTFSAADVLGYRRVPGAGSESLSKEFELRNKNLETIRETMAALQAETAAITAEGWMLNATNQERERERVIRETLAELQRQGIEITPQLRAQVEAEAQARFQAVAAYDAQAAAIDRVRQAQEDLQAVQEEISYAFQGALKGLISDLVHGKDATEALYDAVSQLADRFLDLALDQMFKSFLGAGNAGGGLLGLGGLFNLFGFAGGGFTGYGGKYQPKGIVHGGEYVFSKKATNRIGVGALDQLHKAAKRGYADGGFVIPRIGAAATGRQAQAMAPPVDARTTVINRFDSASFLSEALSQPEGAKLILNVIKAQPAAFRQAIQG